MFSGVSQFSSVLEIVVDAIYHRYDILNSSRARLLFIVFLTVLEFDNMDIGDMLHAASSRLAKQTLLYLTNNSDVNYLTGSWCHVYAVDFTDKHLVGPLKRNRAALLDMIDRLDELDAKVGAFHKKDPTKPKSFVFHQTNRHPVDHVLTEPDVEASLSHEVPRSTYVKPHHLTAEAQMHRNHENNVRVAKMLEGF